jgi:hypothetical protein
VRLVLFVVSLADFDGGSLADPSGGLTAEAMSAFPVVAESPALSGTPIFLIFNKTDVFEEKISKNPGGFRRAYPRYRGLVTSDSARKHVIGEYMQICAGHMP